MANTKLTGKLVLVEDSLTINAKNIINYLVDQQKLGILCLEKTPEKWKSIVKDQNDCRYYTKIANLKNCIVNDGSNTILIDSVNQLAALTNWQETLKLIDQLNNESTIKSLILILHNDCLIYGDKMLKHLRHISQVYISLKCVVSPKRYRVEITSLSSGGKIVKTFNDIGYDASTQKWTNVEVKVDNIKVADSGKRDDAVFKMTSFKIAVEKEAEMVKDDLILPYTEAIKNKNKLVAEPDYEDWDDEDPDDDLCI